jgi:hypothetical protein
MPVQNFKTKRLRFTLKRNLAACAFETEFKAPNPREERSYFDNHCEPFERKTACAAKGDIIT